jgi:hypothetical protein
VQYGRHWVSPSVSWRTARIATRAKVVRGSGSVESIMPGKPPNRPRTDHSEAVRLAWKSRHIPVGTLFVLGLLLACLLSAIFMMIAQGPSNPIP